MQKRLIIAVGLALTFLGAPTALTLTTMADGSTPLAACTSGEEQDVYTTTCVPFLVPTTPQGFTTTAANPDVPEIDGIPCTGHDSGACIGLAEEQQAAGPQPVPQSTIESSP